MPKAPLPHPPGGELTCPTGSTPYVYVNKVSKEVIAECIPIAPGMDTNTVRALLRGKILEIVPGAAHSLSNAILDSGTFEYGDFKFSFVVPIESLLE